MPGAALNRGRRSAAGCRRRPCGRRSRVSGTLRPSSAKRRLPPPRVTGKTIRRSSSRRSAAIRPWTSWAEPATRMTPSTSSFTLAMSAAKSPERTVVFCQSADSERGRVDVLRHRVHLLRRSRPSRVAFALRPGGGEAFVGDPAEQLRLGLLELAELELVALLTAVDLEGPAAVHVVLRTARILDHPVQRDELGGDDLPHDALLRSFAARLVPAACYLDDERQSAN